MTKPPHERLAERLKNEVEWTPTVAARHDQIIRQFTETITALAEKRPDAITNASAIIIQAGGGAQFDNSGFRVLRKTKPEEWRRMVVDFGFAPIIVAIKYDVNFETAQRALDALGGTEAVADTMPHVFDFLRVNPLRGYTR